MRFSVSIVIIAYNTVQYIEDCLNSVLSQNLENTEVIIVDNCSTDGTSEKIISLTKGDNRVKYLRQKKNLGGAMAGNIGIKAASGKYVFLMDSDDVLPEGTLKALYENAEKNKSDIVIGRAKSIYGSEIKNFAFKFYSVPYCEVGLYSGILDKPELIISPFYWGKLYNRKFLKIHRVYMQKDAIYADLYFIAKALKYAKKIAVTDELCYLWRRFDENTDSHISITSKVNQKLTFSDRADSYVAVEKLFGGRKFRSIQKYLRLCNLVKLLIPAKFVPDDEEFADLYFERMSGFLSNIELDDICEFPYISAKKKLFCYFIKNNMKSEFLKYVNPEVSLEKRTEGNSKIYFSKDLPENIPEAVLKQPRSKLKSCELLNVEEENGHWILQCVCSIPPKSRLKLARATVPQNNGEEILFSHIIGEKGVKSKATFSFILPSDILEKLKEGEEYSIHIEYLLNKIFSESPLKYGGEDITLTVSKGILLINKQAITEIKNTSNGEKDV